MTASTIARAAKDPDLTARVEAIAHREVVYNEELAASAYGIALAGGYQTTQVLMWGVAVDTEAAYETAVNSGRGAPGHDVDIITDAALVSAVTAHWPWTPDEVVARSPIATFSSPVPLEGAVHVAQGAPGASYTVEWGDGGGAGALALDDAGEGDAAHAYTAGGIYVVAVLDEQGVPIRGGMSLTVTEPAP